jgi:hypothetical protein
VNVTSQLFISRRALIVEWLMTLRRMLSDSAQYSWLMLPFLSEDRFIQRDICLLGQPQKLHFGHQA